MLQQAGPRRNFPKKKLGGSVSRGKMLCAGRELRMRAERQDYRCIIGKNRRQHDDEVKLVLFFLLPLPSIHGKHVSIAMLPESCVRKDIIQTIFIMP
jgi:hypothetical protein